MLKSYRDLLVWQRAMELVILVYRITAQFPKHEIYGLTSQLRRASVSIPSNIAEGYGRGSRKEYLQFLGIAQGSLKELETQAILAERLNYSTTAQIEKLLEDTDRLGKMLGGLIRSLKTETTR
ncbi:MAG TPA: four helix bundle protein [Pyrinomonadaceae bacterium]|nr:four helix bundle protein [Pyrinomonadaceae bacterium]